MRRTFLSALIAALLAASFAATPAVAAPWVRGFVVSAYEYAFRYGGSASFARAGDLEPGVDCPHGSTVNFSNDAQTRRAVAMQSWRSKQEADYIANPPGVDDTRAPSSVRFHIWVRAIAYRGYKRGIETYVNPFAAEDPGQMEVSGRIGDGFNLDHKIKTGDFVSPDGEDGIDNALYRAWGCDAPWRGNGTATLDLRANDKMTQGLYTMVIRVSGNKDPMNDDEANVEIGYSPDKIVMDARGNVGADYSFRILKSEVYQSVKAKVRNGVVETVQMPDLHVPKLAWVDNQMGDADFHQGMLRLAIASDGSATGLVGGYRNWRDLYAENTFGQDGGQQGVREHEDHLALYFALKRNADGLPDPKTGENTAISSAYRLKASPAYIVDSKSPLPSVLAPGRERNKPYENIRAAMLKAVATRVPQPVPPGTSEASVATMERYVADLKSRDFFLKTLDRPHYPWGDYDKNGNPLDSFGRAISINGPQARVLSDAAK